MTKTLSIVAVTTVCFLVLGCSLLKRKEPLAVSASTHVDRITVRNNRTQDATVTTITDSNRIASIVKFIADHNTSWHGVQDTFPSGRYTIDFYDQDKLVVVLWLGQTSIGGRNGDQFAPDNRLRDLSPEEFHTLVTLLGIEYQAHHAVAPGLSAVTCFLSSVGAQQINVPLLRSWF
ncbi:MAG: hypothetical protein ABJC10_12570 [Acidobacteriota bacterium]